MRGCANECSGKCCREEISEGVTVSTYQHQRVLRKNTKLTLVATILTSDLALPLDSPPGRLLQHCHIVLPFLRVSAFEDCQHVGGITYHSDAIYGTNAEELLVCGTETSCKFENNEENIVQNERPFVVSPSLYIQSKQHTIFCHIYRQRYRR